MRDVVSSRGAPAAIGPYSQAIRAGGFLFISGQIPLDPESGQVVDGDVAAQTRKVLQNMQSVLAESGATMDDVVKVTVFVTNLERHFADIHKVRAEFFKSDYPASTMVEVKALVHEDMLIEIEAIAVTS